MLTLENTETFCVCSYVSQKSNDTFKGECNQKELELHCNQYDSYKKASIFLNKTIYASYYKTNYWTLFNRIKISKTEEKVCKDDIDYIKCGYLDVFKNPLCILEEEEKCPMTKFHFTREDSNTIANITKIENNNINEFIINKIIASEMYNLDLFDINKILTWKNITHPTKKRYGENLFWLNRLFYSVSMTKNNFYSQNNFTNKPFPDWFNGRSIYFYRLVYPGNSIEYPIKKIHITLFNRPARLTIRSFILILKVILPFFIINLKCSKKIIIIVIINILLLLGYLALIILNILSFQGKYYISKNLYEFVKIRNNLLDHDDIGTGITTYFFDIIQTIFEFLIFFLLCFVYISKLMKFNKDDNNKGECMKNEALGKLINEN